ncbi:YTH domain-containing family protein 2 isoform X1 [Dendroctonus ponderosae]|uniref:YTH domain-containing family protein 2 isoform X1 n=1 Tax=Dendroctonus ponderosae TaxID=77166 RepID=UPI0020353C9D|nr:YTH domain-containing family protein 2 isoform X1 [Dendroctonus ponderosae]
MSAGVSDQAKCPLNKLSLLQRMKGQGNQVSNGSKEPIGAAEGATGSEGFEPWRTQQQNSAAHTGYGPSVPISSATDLYNMSTAGYYGNAAGTYPYQTYGVSDGTWSNGTDMTFLSGYPPDSYSMDGIPYSYQNNTMFGSSTTFSTATFQGQPSSFNYFPSNGDYNTWSNQLGGQRKYDEFYGDPSNMYPQPIPESAVKSVEHAMQSLELKSSSDNKDLGQQKKTTWASIASQPAKPPLAMPSQGLKKKGPGMPPGPIVPGKHNIDIGTWETNKSTPPQVPMPMVTCAPLPPQLKTSVPPVAGVPVPGSGSVRPGWNGPQPTARQPQVLQPPPPRGLQHQHQMPPASAFQQPPIMPTHLPPPGPPPNSHIQGMMPAPIQLIMSNSPSQQANHPLLEELRGKNNYNPTDFDLSAPNARFFVIKSYSEDDIHRSIKYDIWCSTEHGNKRLDQAYREREGNGCVYLFFSVNGSGHFCGMAQMITAVDYNSNSSVWSQDKWKGQFKVRWIYVKDVPNVQLRHIHLENNENKSVTNSRDAQEVPHARGLQVLRIMHSYPHSTSIFDDFIHYEKRQEEEDNRKQPVKEMGHHEGGGEGRGRGDHHRGGRNHDRDRDGDRDRNDGHRGGGHRGERSDRDGHHGGGGGGGGGHHRDRDNRSRGGRGGGRN